MLEIIQRQQQIINTQLFHILRHLKKKHEQRLAVNALLTIEQFNGISNIWNVPHSTLQHTRHTEITAQRGRVASLMSEGYFWLCQLGFFLLISVCDDVAERLVVNVAGRINGGEGKSLIHLEVRRMSEWVDILR